jgi:hypothetical protein
MSIGFMFAVAVLYGLAVGLAVWIAIEVFGFSVTATVVMVFGAFIVFQVLEHIFGAMKG